MKLRSGSIVAGASAAVVVALALTGCSDNTNPGSQSSAASSPSASAAGAPTVDAAALVGQSTDVMRRVTGLHLTLVTKGKVPNLKVSKLDGDVSNGPQTVATGAATMDVGQQSVQAKFVYVDGHLYSDVAHPGSFTDYGDGVSIYNVSVILNPDKGIANLLAKLSNPTTAGTEQINGVATTKITGTSSSNDVAMLAGSRLAPQQQTTVPTTVWIASDGSNHLVQLELDPVPGASLTLALSDFGKQVTATKPNVAPS